MILEAVIVGPMEVNCYILAAKENSQALIIDPGAEERKIRKVLDKHKLTPAFIVNTHGHYDHIGCDDSFGVPVYVHAQDAALLRDPQLNLSGLFAYAYSVKSEIRTVEEDEVIELGDIQLKVKHIPGHTPGGMALIMQKPADKIAFTGDTLFCQSIGRSDLAGGDGAQLVRAIKEKLLILPDDTAVYPGHGPASTIGEEKRHNPFLK